jgi:hypothetical protein
MILRSIFLLLLSVSLAFADPNSTETKSCHADKKNCHTEKKTAPVLKTRVETIDTNSANLNRLDEEGFTVRLDCSKFDNDRTKDAKDFLLDLNKPEECLQNSPLFGERVLILMNPVPVTSTTLPLEQTSEPSPTNLPAPASEKPQKIN